MVSMVPIVTVAVEGSLDEAVLVRVIRSAGAEVGVCYGKRGKEYLRNRMRGFNNAARFTPWVVLIDLDKEAGCAAALRPKWLPEPAGGMCFRVAVRAIESWLFGDRVRLAEFLSVPQEAVPASPEILQDPKQAMIELAGRSRRREIREDMQPRPRSGLRTGPGYTLRLGEFSMRNWRPEVARKQVDSLDRCLRAISKVVGRAGPTTRRGRA